MKEQNSFQKLELDTIGKLKELASIHDYNVQADLYYDGQTPVVAYLLLDGNIKILKNKKMKTNLDPGHLIGVKELFHHTPCHHDAKISANSSVCFIDRSTLNEIISSNQEDPRLQKIFSEIIFAEV